MFDLLSTKCDSQMGERVNFLAAFLRDAGDDGSGEEEERAYGPTGVGCDSVEVSDR